jgi:hypothetical protein
MKKMWRIILVTFLVVAIVTSIFASEDTAKAASSDKVYVGVTFGGTTVDEAKQLIDKVYTYTNLFIVDSWTISGNFNDTTPLTEICDYAVQHNLAVIVYFSFIYYNYTRTVGSLYNSSVWDLYGVLPWHVDWLNQAKARWGDMFLGAYLYDEPGGKQIDTGYWGGSTMTTFTGSKITTFVNTSDYADAASRFIRSLNGGSMQHIINTTIPNSVTSPVPVFTADYALYWFDYKAGYNTVFVELGNNLPPDSKIDQIGLCRGAATTQQKDWGAIVTLGTDVPIPTPENGSTVLSDMTMAYKAGAKYILVFNYELNGQGILTDEQFNAMKQFWDNIHGSSSDSFGSSPGQVALVLPANYGWGMRRLNDRMWGLWDPNKAENNSTEIWNNIGNLTEKYGLNLDIVYDDPSVNIQGIYSQTYLWNSTINFASTPTLSNEVYILISVVGSIGAVACVSTLWVTKRRKPKLPTRLVQEFSPSKEVLLEGPITIPNKVEFNPELIDIFNAYANIIDSLHDLLMDLHGHTSWMDIENDLTRCKLAKALEGKISTENLNFRNLSILIKNKKPKEAANEIAFLIETLHGDILALKGKGVSEKTPLEFGSLKSLIQAYFTLNDILLGQALGDEELEKEKIKLAKVLAGFSEKTGSGLFVEFIDRLKLQKTGKLSVDKSREFIRKQINEFFRQN